MLGYSLESFEYVDVSGATNTTHRGVGSDSTHGPSVSSDLVDWETWIFSPTMSSYIVLVDMASSISRAYCQCKDEDSLVECLTYRSFFELGTFYPGY